MTQTRLDVEGPPEFLEIVKELNETKKQVLAILQQYPDARNLDMYLIWIYLSEVLDLDMPDVPYSFFKENAGLTETIRRSRQQIQNEYALYPPTKREILKRRRKKAENYRRFFGSTLCKQQEYEELIHGEKVA